MGGAWDIFVFDHSVIVQVRVPRDKIFISQQQTGMQVSRCLSVGTG